MLRIKRELIVMVALVALLVSSGRRVNADASLEPGNYLTVDQYFSSGGGRWLVVADYGDGYFVDSNVDGWNSLDDWEPCCGYGYHYGQYIYGDSDSVLYMQYDGNAVLYNGDSTVLWATNTDGNSGAYLRIQDGGTYGNLVVYTSGNTPIWSVF